MTDATQTQIRRDTATNLAGATPAEGELGFDLTNKRLVAGDGSTAGGIKHVNYADLQKQVFVYAVAGGTANALTLDYIPETPSMTDGLKIGFKATADNTGAATVVVDARTARSIKKIKAGAIVDLEEGDIISGWYYELAAMGTTYLLTNLGSSSAPAAAQFSTAEVLTSGTTWTVPDNIFAIFFAMTGGGGGGSSVDNSQGPGGGGSQGMFVSGWKAVTPGDVISMAIGTAGTADSNGGDTSFAGITAKGGRAGTGLGGGGAAPGGTPNQSPGAPTTALAITSISFIPNATASAGANSCKGGDGPWGTGGAATDISADHSGSAASGKGAGGGGGNNIGTSIRNGGAGTAGAIVIVY